EVSGSPSDAAAKRESGVCDVFARYLWSEVSAFTEDDWHDVERVSV
ncbi:MAG: hypothetical protein QOF31_805, partial [Mycobacterium sp.]|nr:hypothetical protein [Mycobacterium sp.]